MTTRDDLRGAGATSIWQLFRERRSRDALYHAASYWDARASARQGLSRSLWPSNVYNGLWDERQRTVVERALGDVAGRRVLDVGCGTGRMCRFLLERGAGSVVGVDFSKATVDLAREETEQAFGRPSNPRWDFRQGDVVAGFPDLAAGSFDVVLVLGCLSVACRDKASLERAFANLATLLARGPAESRLLLLEPIHRSPLLRRVLDLGLEDWIAAANRAGLRLVGGDRMGFVPIRMVCSVRDLPLPLLQPLFRAGERLLDQAPYLAPLSDYKLLLFSV